MRSKNLRDEQYYLKKKKLCNKQKTSSTKNASDSLFKLIYIYDCGEMKAANLSGGKREKRSKRANGEGGKRRLRERERKKESFSFEILFTFQK